MKILVTGHKGVIGSYLWKRLDDHERFGIDLKDGQDLATIDVHNLLEIAQPEIVFHLAASFERTKETPEAFRHVWHNDTVASHRLLEAITDCMSVKTVVFASSYLIYKDIYKRSINEDDDVNPRNLCGMSKLYTEKELDFICSSIRPDIRPVHARIFRVYGEGGKEIVSRWCRAKLTEEKTVIFNQDNRFDFIHAQDVAEGLMRLAFTEEARGIVNLGTGQSISIKEVCESIGLSPEKIEDDPDYEQSCADIHKLFDLTGWIPAISIKAGIDRIMNWQEKKLSLRQSQEKLS